MHQNFASDDRAVVDETELRVDVEEKTLSRLEQLDRDETDVRSLGGWVKGLL